MPEEEKQAEPEVKKEEKKIEVKPIEHPETKRKKINKLTMNEVVEKLNNAQKEMGGGSSRYIGHLKKRKEFLEKNTK